MSVMPFTGALLQVCNLSVALSDGTEIVSDISFSVRAGEIVGVVGESGSGKTSIATALLGDARGGAVIAGGAVLIDGRNLLSLSEGERQQMRGARIAHVAQDPTVALNPMVRIGKVMDEMLRVHLPELGKEERQHRIEAAAKDVGVPTTAEFLRRFPHQISGGQQQRVLLALAVLLHPRLIVLDEPTTALDVTTQARVLATLRNLCRNRGIGAVYVSHDLAVVSELVDRVVVLYAGHVVESGARDQIFARPAHPYTRGLLGAVPDITGQHAVTPIPGFAPALRERSNGCAFAPRCDWRTAQCAERPALADIGSGYLVACHHALRDKPQTRLSEQRKPPIGEEMVLASLSGISASYGTNQVLIEVDLELPQGRCTALVGESGSGKTTFARSLVGLVESAQGNFSYDGQDIPWSGKRSHDLRRRIQYIFQNPHRALNPRQTVGGILGTAVRHFFPISRAEADHAITEVLERVALPSEIAQRYPRDLSGGERQRVAIARALICRPDLLICDEITSALDVSVQAAIINLLRRLQQETGLTVLFVTHDFGVVRAIADYVAVLQHGKVVEYGAVDTVLEHPSHPYTRGLVANAPRSHQSIVG